MTTYPMISLVLLLAPEPTPAAPATQVPAPAQPAPGNSPATPPASPATPPEATPPAPEAAAPAPTPPAAGSEVQPESPPASAAGAPAPGSPESAATGGPAQTGEAPASPEAGAVAPTNSTAPAAEAASPVTPPASGTAPAPGTPPPPGSPPEPASAPGAAPPPGGGTGGAAWTPLPPPPPGADPRWITDRPWRGRGWFTAGIDLAVPVRGQGLARGEVVAGVGHLTFGYRPLHWLGLATGFETWVHDADDRITEDDFGTAIEARDFGRVFMFDLATVRFFLPGSRRIEPFVDVGGGVGMYRPPFRNDVLGVGSGTVALGMEAWLGPTFSLTVGAQYRLLAIRNDVGHLLQFGLGATVHW